MEAATAVRAEAARSAAELTQRRREARPRGGALVRSGVVWILAVAALLAGVVAVNVSVLRLNVELSQAERERARLQAGNAELASKLSSAAATERIERLARTRLGLVPADPARTVYLRLRPEK